MLEVFVVALKEGYDFQIDSGLKVWEVTEAIAELVRQMLKESGRESERFHLGSKKLKCVLEEERLLKDYSIEEGDQLFLF